MCKLILKRVVFVGHGIESFSGIRRCAGLLLHSRTMASLRKRIPFIVRVSGVFLQQMVDKLQVFVHSMNMHPFDQVCAPQYKSVLCGRYVSSAEHASEKGLLSRSDERIRIMAPSFKGFHSWWGE